MIEYVSRSIFVTFEKIGYHLYPAAATDETLKDVAYLGAKHRHKFFFKVEMPVEHDNRDLEFHQVLNRCLSYYDKYQLQLDHFSCEMMAEALIDMLNNDYEVPWIEVTVSEDNECGARIRKTKYIGNS